MPELVGSLSPVKEWHFRRHRVLIKVLWLGKFPLRLLSGCQAAVGPFSECCANVLRFSASDKPQRILVPTSRTNGCSEWCVLRRTDILMFSFYCKLGEWCWKTLLASENTLTRSHVAYKILVAFRSGWQASFRLEYCCVTFLRTSRAEIFDRKTGAQHQGLLCSWIFHVFVWEMLGSKTLSLSLL